MDDELGEYVVQYYDEDESTNWIKKAGKARVNYPNGDVYEGDFDETKKKHGEGRYQWKVPGADELEVEDEEDRPVQFYDGQWFQGYRHGVGLMMYPTGASYSGTWEKGKKHGEGAYKYANGDIYSGSWVNNEKHGAGTYVYADDVQLVGIWVHNKIDSGKWIFKDGTVFVGKFEDNKPLGRGSFAFHNGNKQKGEYVKQGPEQVLRWAGEPIEE